MIYYKVTKYSQFHLFYQICVNVTFKGWVYFITNVQGFVLTV